MAETSESAAPLVHEHHEHHDHAAGVEGSSSSVVVTEVPKAAAAPVAAEAPAPAAVAVVAASPSAEGSSSSSSSSAPVAHKKVDDEEALRNAAGLGNVSEIKHLLSKEVYVDAAGYGTICQQLLFPRLMPRCVFSR